MAGSWSINNWRNSKDGQLLLLAPTHFRISSFYQDEDDEYPDEADDGDDKNTHSDNFAGHWVTPSSLPKACTC